jgi:hypothetical protein
MHVAPIEPGQGSPALAKLFAREQVEDCEMRRSAGEAKEHVEREIERLGLEFQIATCMTSWVAATEDRSVDPRDPSRHVVQPHALAYGMSAEGLGLRAHLPMPAPQMSLGSPMPGGSAEGFGGVRRRIAAPAASRPMPAATGRGMPPPAPRAAKSLPARAAELLRRAVSGPKGAVPAGIVGRIVQLATGELVVEFDSPGFELAYAVLTITLHLADGTAVRVQPVVARSTTEGPIAAGLRIRVVLGEPPAAVDRITLEFSQAAPVIVQASR